MTSIRENIEQKISEDGIEKSLHVYAAMRLEILKGEGVPLSLVEAADIARSVLVERTSENVLRLIDQQIETFVDDDE